MIFELNQLVLTPFGYGTITNIPPMAIPLPDASRSEGSVQEGPAQPIDKTEIQDKLRKIESEQRQKEQEQQQQQSQDQAQQQPEQSKSPEPPKAPLLDPIYVEAINQLPKLNTQTSKKSLESPDDPFPFPNLGVVPSPPPPPPGSAPSLKKPPFIIQLSHKFKEAMEAAHAHQKSIRNAHQDERIISVKLKQSENAFVYAPAHYIGQNVYILIKTFFGSRSYYLACVQFQTQIKHLIKLVSDKACENPKMLHNIRLIHPMGILKELKDHNATVADSYLGNFTQLIILAQMSFFFDPAKKGKAITLSNNNCTINKQGDSDFQTVLGTLPMSSGRQYWEIRIDKFVDEEDIFIGVARKEIDLYAQPITTGMFWGYICLCARKCGPEGILTKYGQSAKVGDTIGVLLEFKGGVGSLSFYRNGARLGEAFSNLTGTFYPAVSLFYGEVQVSLDSKAPFPIN